MKTRFPLLILASVLLLMTGCYKQEYLDCPEGRYIYFRSVLEKYSYEEIAHNLDLYLYDAQGGLVDTYVFSREQLLTYGHRVPLPFQPEGEYLLVAAVNYSDEYYEMSDHGSLESFTTSLKCSENQEVLTKPCDIYHAYKGIKFDRHSVNKKETEVLDLYKNTNNFNVTVRFKGGRVPANRVITARMEGSNGAYDHRNNNTSFCRRVYYPHTEDLENKIYGFTTMHLHTASDMILRVDAYDKGTRSEGELRESIVLNISDYLSRVKDATGSVFLYDTDEKLDREDYFEINIWLDGQFRISGIVINNWSLIDVTEDF